MDPNCEKQFLLEYDLFRKKQDDYGEQSMFTHREQVLWRANPDDKKVRSHKKSFFRWISANIRDYILFGYFTPYMCRAAYQGGASVVPELIPSLKERDNISVWTSRFSQAAHREWNRAEGPSHFALLRCLLVVFWKHFLAIFLVKLIRIGLDILTTRSLKIFLASEEKMNSDYMLSNRVYATLLGLLVIIIQFSHVFVCSQMEFWFSRVVMRLEGCLGTCLFRSTLISSVVKDHHRGHQDVETVQQHASAYNLLTVDVPSIARSTLLLLDLLVLPIGIYFYFLELKYNVGEAAEAGLYGIGAVISVLLLLELYNGYLKKPLLRCRDIRLHLLHNFIVNIQRLRLVNWEAYAMHEVAEARKAELKVRRTRMYVHGVSWALSDCSRYILQLIIFSTYVILTLRSKDTFVFSASVIMPTLQLIFRLMGPLTDISFLLHSLLEGAVSFIRYQAHIFGYTRRCKKILTLQRKLSDDSIVSVDGHHHQHYDKLYGSQPLLSIVQCDSPETTILPSNVCKCCVTLNDAIFSWLPNQNVASRFTITIPHFQLERGQTLILLGHPGSGKTSFIHALLGELFRIKGSAKVRRTWQPIINESREVLYPVTPTEKDASATSVGYASQIPWLPEGTVRNAILLGRLYDAERYERVVQACELEYDFSFWPEGDQRLILQDGLNLSTGQRVRINLARALYDFPILSNELASMAYKHIDKHGYQGSSLFLLDSVFSSLDPSVGLLVYRHLLSGTNPLLRHAATVITIDEQNLLFFHQTLRLLNQEPRVDIIYKTMRNGILTDYQPNFSEIKSSSDLCKKMLHFEHEANRLTKPQTKVKRDRVVAACVPSRKSSVSNFSLIVTEKNESCSVESPHKGGIGFHVYLFYFKKCGFCLTLLALFLASLLTVQRMSSEVWLAHWSGMSQEATVLPFKETPMGVTSPPSTMPSLDSHNPLPDTSLTDFLPDSLPPNDKEEGETKNQGNETQTQSTSRLFEDKDLLAAAPKRYSIQIESKIPNKDPPRAIQKHNRDDPTLSQTFLRAYSSTKEYKNFNRLLGVTSNLFISLPQSGVFEKLTALLVTPIPAATALRLFVWLSATVILTAFVLMILTTYTGLCGAVKMHQDLLSGITKTCFWVYDSLTVGVIINRFNSDIQVVDTAPGLQLNRLVMGLVHFFLVITILCLLRPSCIFLIPVVGWFVYYFIYKLYRPSCREFQRSMLLAWSPLTGNISEAERGNVVIRALGVQPYYIKKNIFLTSQLLKVQFMQNGVICWGTTRFQLLASTFSIFNSVLPIMFALFGMKIVSSQFLKTFMLPFPFFQKAAYIGLATTYAMELPSCVRNIVTYATYLDKSMCSVQRVKALIQLTEAAREQEELSISDYYVKKISDMPLQRFGLHIRDMVVAYRKPCGERKMRELCKENLNFEELRNQFFAPVISNFNATIRPGEHIGIVGRTGAAKSSLLFSIAGFTPVISGEISLDGIPIHKISPQLRHRLVTVLPPVPVIVKGWTVRQFLDPESVHPSTKILEAIDKVQMSNIIRFLPNGLDTVIIKDELNLAADSLESVNCIEHETTLEALGYATDSGSSNRYLSDSQLRTLSVARLSLASKTCRVVLIDEPPTKQFGVSGKQECNANEIQDIEIGPLLRQLFPEMIVITAAHYASSVKYCDRVWIISNGELKKEISGSDFLSQETLSYYINEHSENLHEN